MMKKSKNVKSLMVYLLAIVAILTFCLTVFAQTTSEKTLSLVNKNVSFKDSVYMNFRVKGTNVSASNMRLLIWEAPQTEYLKGTEVLEVSSSGRDKDGYEVFQYKKLAARDMTKVIYYRAYANENGEEIYSNVNKFSIVEYVYKINKLSGQEKIQNLLKAMLDYGAKAQIYFNHNLDFLANEPVCEVKIVNGTFADGFNVDYVKVGSQITLKANENSDSMEFSHFKDSADNKIGYSNTLTITAKKDETYSAVFNMYSPEGLAYSINPDGQTCNITGIGRYSASNNLNIPTTVGKYSVIGIANKAFESNSTLSSVNIPDSVTNIGREAFSNCSGLTSINLGNSVTHIGVNAFFNCESLNKVDISDTANFCCIAFDNEHSNPLNYAHNLYLNGSIANSVTIPDNVTAISNYAFKNCSSITSLTMGTNVTVIGNESFENCSNISIATLSDNLISIGNSAFYGCAKLCKISIGKNMNNVDAYAFDGCTYLNRVCYNGTDAEWQNINIDPLGNSKLISANRNAAKYDIAYTASKIVVDGVKDSVYDNSLMIEANVPYSDSAKGPTGSSKAWFVVTNEGMYAYAEVKDDTVFSQKCDDKISIYVDFVNDHVASGLSGSEYLTTNRDIPYWNGNRLGYIEVYGSGNVVPWDGFWQTGKDKLIEATRVLIDGGYAVEMFFPFPEGGPCEIIGIGLQSQDDTDGNGSWDRLYYDTANGSSYYTDYTLLPDYNITPLH